MDPRTWEERLELRSGTLEEAAEVHIVLMRLGTPLLGVAVVSHTSSARVHLLRLLLLHYKKDTLLPLALSLQHHPRLRHMSDVEHMPRHHHYVLQPQRIVGTGQCCLLRHLTDADLKPPADAHTPCPAPQSLAAAAVSQTRLERELGQMAEPRDLTSSNGRRQRRHFQLVRQQRMAAIRLDTQKAPQRRNWDRRSPDCQQTSKHSRA